MTDAPSVRLNSCSSGPLVAAMRERNSTITESEAKLAVARVFDSVIELTKTPGASLRVAGFGTFTNKHKPERTARNPSNGESIKVAAKDVVVFKPGKSA